MSEPIPTRPMQSKPIIADLHIHSRFSRGCSTDLTIPKLETYARLKGISLLGTGDFTHPQWLGMLKETLTEDKSGILRTESRFPFMLQTELSLIYSQGGKGRRIHVVVLAPTFDVVDQIVELLKKRGRLDYDGRPIFNIPCPEFVGLMKSISEEIEIIPAHIWTPWFSLFGSKSGFDSVRECFQDQTKHIHALETGLSSDPAMNWRISELDNYRLVSFSDSHSYWPWRLGREATIFKTPFTYQGIMHALKTGEGLAETLEFWPHEGKYHYDGHRACGIVYAPKESTRHNNICPVCKKPLTIGVLHRVEELADREEGFVPKDAPSFRNIIPLSECIAGVLGAGVATKKVWEKYHVLVKHFGNELSVLLSAPEDEIARITSSAIAGIIIKNRNQEIEVSPGYDGVYGQPLFSDALHPSKASFPAIERKQKSSSEPGLSLSVSSSASSTTTASTPAPSAQRARQRGLDEFL